MSIYPSTNAEYLGAELRQLDCVLRRQARKARHSTSDADPLRLAYVSETEVERLLDDSGREPEDSSDSRRLDRDIEVNRADLDARVEAALNAGRPLALPRLSRIFALDAFEERVLLLALAPELDLKYERIFAYLQDDLTKRRATLDLALRLFAASRLTALPMLARSAPLFRFGLLSTQQAAEGPWLASPVALDESTAQFLIDGSLRNDEWLSSAPPGPPLEALRWPLELTTRLLSIIEEHANVRSSRRLLCQFVGPLGTGRKALASALCRTLGIPLMVADVRLLVREQANAELNFRRVLRRGLLLQAAVYFDHCDVLNGPNAESLRDAFARALLDLSWLTFLGTLEPTQFQNVLPERTFVSVPLPVPSITAREQLWAQLGKESGNYAGDVDCTALAARFRITPGAMRTALHLAEGTARLRGPGESLTALDLTAGCYAQATARLGELARKLPGKHRWADLILPSSVVAQLAEICLRLRHRRRVYEDWGFDKRLSWSTGLCALFFGPSGAGKTMAADVIAHELDLEAFRVDLSTVVSKYIGETEKNLSRLFDEAQASNAILFFDEADALFGKRTEVKDAHDRYANIETNYLLQRIEEFDGLVILASNLRKNIDDGFFRRMHFAVEFSLPEGEQRYRIWRSHLPAEAPLSESVDLGFLAGRFAVAGGNIRNIVLNAAFLAAEDGGTIDMSHLLRATRREYEKLGKLCTAAEFAPYYHLLSAE